MNTNLNLVPTIPADRYPLSGRDILPPMPWQGVAKLTDSDLKALFAYLRSIPAIENHVAPPVSPTGANDE